MFMLLFLTILILSACNNEPEKNHILITHSDQPEPTDFPADVTYNYIIEDGYELPKDNLMVTFKWKQNGSYNQKFWLYEVKQNEDGYTVIDTEYDGFYVADIEELGYSPVSTLIEHKGTFVVNVKNKAQYEAVIGDHPYKKGTHQFEDILIKKDKTK
jgi:hypothetical protein